MITDEQLNEALRVKARERGYATCPAPIVILIAQEVALAFGIDPAEITSDRKFTALSRARAVTCYIARKCTVLGYSEIGRALKKDHSSVMSAVRRVAARRERDQWTDSVCAVLVERFGAIEEKARQ